MTATPSPAPIGSNVTYTILVTNNSPSAATGVSVSDNLPSELTFVSASAPLGWTSSLPAVGTSGLVSFEKDTPLAIGQTATIIIIAKVASSTKTGANIINSAQAVTTGTDSDMSNNIATENLRVGTASPNFVQLVASGRPNPLTGLFEIDVNVKNTTPLPINGFRLHVDFSAYNISYPSLRLYNATSSPGAGDVYVDHPYPVNVDGTVSLKLSFYTATRTFPSPFSPVLTVETLASSQLPGTDGSGVQPILKSLPDSTILLEFSSVPGRWYRVHYSSDLQNWSESPVPIQASTDRMQWIDSGAPFTNVPPSKTKSRYYRVNEIAAP
jgi:uncharacterized repeat protein (TIGR01451 family)